MSLGGWGEEEVTWPCPAPWKNLASPLAEGQCCENLTLHPCVREREVLSGLIYLPISLIASLRPLAHSRGPMATKTLPQSLGLAVAEVQAHGGALV